MILELNIRKPRPFFAEVPYYLWGEVNYNSEGDCRRPTDQEWTWFELRNRENREQVTITGKSSQFLVESDEPELAARAVRFLIDRSDAKVEGEDPARLSGSWSHPSALARTQRVRAEFPRPELKPFDSMLFWGSWKWVGWYATDLTWVGRWIMHSLLTRDTRAVNLCVEWLRQGTVHKDQSTALQYALQCLTNESFRTDADWIRWYDAQGHQEFPVPDFDAWLADLKHT
jgi:hypothetical protein